MKYIGIIIIVLFGFHSESFSQEEFVGNLDWEPVINPTYWENPNGEIFNSSKIDMLNEMGSWIYFEIDAEGNRVDLLEREITCECSAIASECYPNIIFDPVSCSLAFDIDAPGCDVEPYWIDPDGETLTDQSIDESDLKNGEWKLVLDSKCETTVDSVEFYCPLEELCDNINTSVSGRGNWSDLFISDGIGILNLNFYTQSVPDRLNVRINGELVVDSDNYSSLLCKAIHCNEVLGCGEDFNIDVPVNLNDEIDIEVIANPCMASSTNWNLTTTCDGTLISRGRQSQKEFIYEEVVTYFPNPTKGILNIEYFSDEYPETFTFYNTLGVKVFESPYSSLESIIDVSSLPAGIYSIRADYRDYVNVQLITIVK